MINKQYNTKTQQYNVLLYCNNNHRQYYFITNIKRIIMYILATL